MNGLKDPIIRFLELIIRWVRMDLFFPSLIALASAWCFIDVAADVYTRDDITVYDEWIVSLINQVANLYQTRFVVMITDFGSALTIFTLLLVIVAAFTLLKRRRDGLFLFLSTGIGALLTVLIKELFYRSRPVLEAPVHQEVGYSFPSGHAAISTCFYGALLYWFIINTRSWVLKVITGLLVFSLVMTIGLTRIYLGVHYPSDVLAGFMLGLFCLNLSIILVYKPIPISFKRWPVRRNLQSQ